MEKEGHLELWRLRRRLEYIENMKPAIGTSVFSILIRPDDQVTKIRAMLNEEYAKSANIKSNQNRLSVQEGLKTISEYLKAFRFFPSNGLACYYGSAVLDSMYENQLRLKVFFEPPKCIPRFVYNCDSLFETNTLRELLEDKSAIGYIIIDGKGTLFATVRGNEKTINFKMSVDLPRKHTRGGQSAARFARIREDARKTYIGQVCDKATEVFISDNVPIVSNLVIAGQAQLKECLEKSSKFDSRLKPIILCLLTIDYGGEAGLNEAIRISSADISNTRLSAEIKLINSFLEHLSRGTEHYVAYGVRNVLEALDEGAADTVIAWQNLPLLRWIVQKTDAADQNEVLCLAPHEKPQDFGALQVIECMPLIDWLAENVSKYGSKLELVSTQSTEGTMLVEGFSGLVALLRYERMSLHDSEENCSIEFDLLDGTY